MSVQGHDIQVVGITREDVFNQVRRTGERSFWVDSFLTGEGGVSGGSHVGDAGSIDPNRGEWPLFAETDSPRIEEHAGEIAGVVDMKMREEEGLQSGEVETGRREFGGRTRPQSTTKTLSSSTSAEQIPARPTIGIGAPAVPSSTNSVVMDTCLTWGLAYFLLTGMGR